MKPDLRRRLFLLIFISAASLIAGIFLLDVFWAEKFVTYAGYPLILAGFLVFAWHLGRDVAERLPRARAWYSRERGVAAAVICASTVFLFLHEPIGFKVLLDEAVLLGTSMMMHFERLVLVPSVANRYEGSFRVVEAYLDKRTLFHPFLVSLIHTFTGYRPANIFVLNVILTPVFLTLAWICGHRLSGFKGALLTVLLLISVPLIAQNATGGHFEILNLVMILAAMLLAGRYLERLDDRSLILLCYAGILLAQTRYESVLFVFPIGIVVLLGWHRKGAPILPWPVVLAPVLLIAYTPHFRFVASKEAFWQLSDFDHAAAFSLQYVIENYGHALHYLFFLGQNLSNSFLLSVTGCAALVFFGTTSVKHLGRWYRDDLARFVLAMFSVAVLASFALILCYHWGQLNDLVASRFAMPLLLIFALATAAVVPTHSKPYLLVSLAVGALGVVSYLNGLDSEGFLRSGYTLMLFMTAIVVGTLLATLDRVDPMRFVTVVTVAFIFFVTLPWNANHRFSQRYTPAREADIILRFIREHPRKDYFLITNSPQMVIAHLVPGVSVRRTNEKPANVARHIEHKTYSDFFVYQKVAVDVVSGIDTVMEGFGLNPVYQLETVEEQWIIPGLVGRISRISRVDLEDSPGT